MPTAAGLRSIIPCRLRRTRWSEASCPGCGAARAPAKQCTADPGPPRTVTIPGLQRTTRYARAAPRPGHEVEKADVNGRQAPAGFGSHRRQDSRGAAARRTLDHPETGADGRAVGARVSRTGAAPGSRV